MDNLTTKYFENGQEHVLFDFTETVREYGAAPLYSDIGLEYYKDCLVNGKVIGVYNQSQLVAYGIVIFPGIGPLNYARWLDVPDNELLLCAVMDGAIVHPDYRGMSIQTLLISLREDIAKDYGCLHSYISIHPQNKASRRNAEKSGYVMKLERNKYPNTPRCFYYKEL